MQPALLISFALSGLGIVWVITAYLIYKRGDKITKKYFFVTDHPYIDHNPRYDIDYNRNSIKIEYEECRPFMIPYKAGIAVYNKFIIDSIRKGYESPESTKVSIIGKCKEFRYACKLYNTEFSGLWYVLLPTATLSFFSAVLAQATQNTGIRDGAITNAFSGSIVCFLLVIINFIKMLRVACSTLTLNEMGKCSRSERIMYSTIHADRVWLRVKFNCLQPIFDNVRFLSLERYRQYYETYDKADSRNVSTYYGSKTKNDIRNGTKRRIEENNSNDIYVNLCALIPDIIIHDDWPRKLSKIPVSDEVKLLCRINLHINKMMRSIDKVNLDDNNEKLKNACIYTKFYDSTWNDTNNKYNFLVDNILNFLVEKINIKYRELSGTGTDTCTEIYIHKWGELDFEELYNLYPPTEYWKQVLIVQTYLNSLQGTH